VEAGIRNGDASLTTDYYETQTGPILSDPIENPKSFVKTAQQTKEFCKSDQ
jgi:hypothetical protein